MYNLAFCNCISSTQVELINAIRNGFKEHAFALATLKQTNGIGSCNRNWISDNTDSFGNINSKIYNQYFKDIDFIFFDEYNKFNLDIKNNLYLSFFNDNLPDDLPIQSASIYYSMIMKIVLKEFGSKVFIKWPNDFYLDNKKIGGLITAKIKDKLVCGIGINITTAPVDANILDIDISYSTLLKTFFDRINLNISWKEIFDYYKSDFELSRSFYFKNDDNTYSLNDVKLYEDGSILVDNKRIYSLR